jgi:hypothetical protein
MECVRGERNLPKKQEVRGMRGEVRIENKFNVGAHDDASLHYE